MNKIKLGSPQFTQGHESWNCFHQMSRLITTLLRAISQISVAYTLVTRHSSTYVFVALYLLKPMLLDGDSLSLWTRREFFLKAPWLNHTHLYQFPAHIVYCVNKAYEKMAMLHRLVYSESFHVDRISDGIGSHIGKGHLVQSYQ